MPLADAAAAKLHLGEQTMTLRQVVHISQGGRRLRLVLSNQFGTTPLQISNVHVAFLGTGSTIIPKTDSSLTFGGQSSTTIAPGQTAATDALKGKFPIYSDLVISMTVPAQAMHGVTYHGGAHSTTFLAQGDHAADADFTALPTAPATTTSTYFLQDVEVERTRKSVAVVAFGDSITEGANSTTDGNHRWPDEFAALLAANKKTKTYAVLNAGISGNRILHEGTGPSAFDRFDHDALQKDGVHTVILLEGINDIGHTYNPPLLPVTVDQVIGGLKTLAQRAHARGLKIYAGTLTPIGGSKYDLKDADAMRQQVNAYVRSNTDFDGFIDFDKAVRDPQHPEKMLSKYDSGDHLHPGDAGYAAMAAAVNLKMIAKK